MSNATAQAEIYRNLKFNLTVNLLDGGFYGFALGFASFVTIIPLFVSTMTDSAVLIGLIPSIHFMGWQLLQLLTVRSVSRRERLLPFLLKMTINERVPFIGLALIALLMGVIGTKAALALTFLMLVWQGFGGGLTATAWQSMIGKIMPPDRRGVFFGAQAAAANGLAAVSAVIAGFILERLPSPADYVICFLLCSVFMAVSYAFIAMTREPAVCPPEFAIHHSGMLHGLRDILRRDKNFRGFLVVRALSQVALMGFAFYTVYAVRHHGLSEAQVGVMTGVLMVAQLVVSPLLGWIGDKWSYSGAMQIGLAAAVLSTLLAWWAPSAIWFYLVFFLAALGNTAVWTVGLAMILEFGSEAERPAYIGLSNTLVAPMTLLAPLLGGFLADAAGYPAAFIASAIGGLATMLALRFLVRDPRRLRPVLVPAIGDPESLPAGEND